MGTLEQELQKIYDSEINLSISWMWDAGFDLKLGDEFGGFVEEGQVRSVADILPWFQEAIAKRYPTSQYHVERMGGTFTPEFVEPIRGLSGRPARSLDSSDRFGGPQESRTSWSVRVDAFRPEYKPVEGTCEG